MSSSNKVTMMIDRKPIPIGDVKLTFVYAADEKPPYAQIDVLSPEGEELGGIALNCLSLGNIPEISALAGRDFSFGEGTEHTEIRESVFWRPKHKTLEIERLDLKFGALFDGVIEMTAEATCFTLMGLSKYRVAVAGLARIEAS